MYVNGLEVVIVINKVSCGSFDITNQISQNQRWFSMKNKKGARYSDSMSPSCLKVCTERLAPIFTIISVPKKPSLTELRQNSL